MRVLWIIILLVPFLASISGAFFVLLSIINYKRYELGPFVAFILFCAMAIYLLRLIVKTFNPNAGIVAISPGGSAAEPDLKTRKILTWIAFGSTYFVLGIGAAVLSGHNNLTIWIVVGFFAIMILFRWFAIIIDTYARKVKNKRPTV